MNDYIETRVDITPCDEIATDLVAYNLCEIGYESFVADLSGVTAYRPVRIPLTDEQILDAITEAIPDYKFTVKHTSIEGEDWNKEWEQHYFQPIVVGDNRLVIHSSFHKDFPKCDYDIVIDPKMAFGTGHHATTSLIVNRLLGADLIGKSLIDMGTGTAILAIVAAMRGASPVTGIEIDPVAYDNAIENVALNGHSEITLICGDASALDQVEPSNWLVANINRNVITADIDRYASHIVEGGTALFSGFYIEDVPIIEKAAALVGLKVVSVDSRDRWACVQCIKQ
ncbi:MAG: 50S ribosomal protein L11 methyltransferase [Muribaculaceae bacterium]|nr:50S ribosomal protein L11 methyltransferase [Muribaculaceae bacterium]